MRKFLVIYEKMESNWGAYCPDVPGCVATGSTQAVASENFREALEFHFDGLRKQGLPIPVPAAEMGYVLVEI